MKQRGFIFGGIQMYLMIAAAAAIIAAGGYVFIKINSLNSEINDLTQKNSALVAENAMLSEVNKKNAEVMQQISEDKKRSDKIASDFRIQKARDNAEIEKLKDAIGQIIRDDPTANGPVSPVLRTTIQKIIDSRTPKTTGEKK